MTNTSVNPARSTAVAFFAETGAVGQLWLFWVAPLIGAALGGVIWKALFAPVTDLPLEGNVAGKRGLTAAAARAAPGHRCGVAEWRHSESA